MSTSGDQDVPKSSVLRVIQTVRTAPGAPSVIWRSVAVPGLLVRRRKIMPALRSTTAVGLPMVSAPLSAIFSTGDQVLPPRSKLRRRRTSISPASFPEFFRPSQKASSVPLGVAIRGRNAVAVIAALAGAE